ncbi:uncharacterized protein NDAI_0D04010 [Naumovozyma dairenensis CBS 421]|uniref:6-phosphofructo-2-kinase domain-containing protein n=1 Tax=Naumovozyma dairenensis (strain ATCC 10597 / BCRC 20456 / CBS 421 / NBRC 0211 / NRRL Y-12639) TaxID=1071378 RepID=G0WAA4_NAUDC|nr:hypothetical protein NDAI_0D04010 [Naumovozyma dairenensis CBS 421]CCD24715.1 hypothetical protein NDAI_0D04010 [Naumovozyma dairenensis CBS 421]
MTKETVSSNPINKEATITNHEELHNGLGSEEVRINNHMARTNTRWQNQNHSSNRNHDFYPGQLYGTESGKLFHAGKIMIVLVGLPATSKTLLAHSLERYCKWLGVVSRVFNLADYRRKFKDVPKEYFFGGETSTKAIEVRKQIRKVSINDMKKFFQEENGQLAIFDAMNTQKMERRCIQENFQCLNVNVLFVESIMTDKDLTERNIKLVMETIKEGNDEFDKKIRYSLLNKMLTSKPSYEEIEDSEKLSYVKFNNFGKQIVVKNNHQGYLLNKLVFFLMNLRSGKGRIFFCSSNSIHQEDISNCLKSIYNRVIEQIKKEDIVRRNFSPSLQEDDRPNSPILTIWCEHKFQLEEDSDIELINKSQLRRMNLGAIEGLSEEEIEKQYPKEYKESFEDLYHYRYPRAESYHDLAIRLEGLLLELEHQQSDLLIFADESVLRILYGYFMSSSCIEVPLLNFGKGEIVELSLKTFSKEIKKL